MKTLYVSEGLQIQIVEILACPVFIQLLTGRLTCWLSNHATGGGRRMGAVEHWSWHLWLLPHQCHGGEDPHVGKCPLHPPVCDCRPVSRPHPAHDLYTMEKTLTGTQPRNHQKKLFCHRIFQGTFHPHVGPRDHSFIWLLTAEDQASSVWWGCPKWGQEDWRATYTSPQRASRLKHSTGIVWLFSLSLCFGWRHGEGQSHCLTRYHKITTALPQLIVCSC